MSGCRTMQAPSELSVPAPVVLAGWWGDKFSRLFLEHGDHAAPEAEWTRPSICCPTATSQPSRAPSFPKAKSTPGTRKCRCACSCGRIAATAAGAHLQLADSANRGRGEHRILLSDAETLNRIKRARRDRSAAQSTCRRSSRYLNQERGNDKLYVSLDGGPARPFLRRQDAPSLPASVLNVIADGPGGQPPVREFRGERRRADGDPLGLRRQRQGYALRVTVK